MSQIRSPKKLIEVALPLDDINVASAREKSIRHGHPSTLHLWWARRPLAAARAVIFAQMVNDPGGERGYYAGKTKAQADAEREELFQVPTHRRAVIIAGPARSVRGDQLGLLRRSVEWSEPVELFVHPKTVRLHATAAGLVRDLEGQVSNRITNNDLAFHALRPYVPGDDRRYVHWRTSARIGQLMVRQFQETRRSQIVLALTTRQVEDGKVRPAGEAFADIRKRLSAR